MFKTGDQVTVRGCMGDRSVTRVKRLTTQNLIDNTLAVCAAFGIRVSPDCEFPEIVPNDQEWLGRDEVGPPNTGGVPKTSTAADRK